MIRPKMPHVLITMNKKEKKLNIQRSGTGLLATIANVEVTAALMRDG